MYIVYGVFFHLLKNKKKSLNSLKDFTSALPFKRELKSRVLLNIPACFHLFLVTYLHQSFAKSENNYKKDRMGVDKFVCR